MREHIDFPRHERYNPISGKGALNHENTQNFLDTSIISYLQQDDAPDKMSDTLLLWEDIKAGLYDVHVSDVTLAEIGNCAEPKRTKLLELLSGIQYTEIIVNAEIEAVALSL
jgi:predicted nucleic acid-binding protein